MIPLKTESRWKDLVTGRLKHQFRFVPAGLMISRLSRQTASDASEEHVSLAVEEAYNFFNKYQNVFQDDIKAIFG